MDANFRQVEKIEISRSLQEKSKSFNFEHFQCKLGNDYIYGVGYIN